MFRVPVMLITGVVITGVLLVLKGTIFSIRGCGKDGIDGSAVAILFYRRCQACEATKRCEVKVQQHKEIVMSWGCQVLPCAGL